MTVLKLPWSWEAEIHVIGAALLDPSLPTSDCRMDAADFEDGINRTIWDAISRLASNGGYSSSVDVWRLLEAEGAHAKCRERLIDAEEAVPSSTFGAHHATTVRRLAALRRFAKVCASTWEGACTESEPATQPAVWVAEQASAIAQAAKDFELTGSDEGLSASRAVGDEVAALEQRIANPASAWRLTTGFPDVDRKVLGMERGEYWLLGARPSMGKTAMSLQIAAAACDQGARVSFFSLEQRTSRIMQRMLSQVSQVEFAAIRTAANFNDNMVRNINRAQDAIGKWNLTIRDQPMMKPSAIRAAAARDKSRHGLDLVIVDHLHHVRPDERSDSRYVQVSSISKAFKAMAKDLDCPVLLCAQLSRDAHDASRPPSLRHLRDAGTLEEDCDVCLLIHRPGYYMTDDDGSAQVAVAKARDGEVGPVPLVWRSKVLRFENKGYGR